MTATQTARPDALTANGLYKLAVWDGWMWLRPDASLRDCKVGGFGQTPPAQPSLLAMLQRMERGGVEQLWIHPTTRGARDMAPTVDQLAECEAAGWRFTVSRADGDTKAGAWVSATHSGVYAVRHVYYPALDPASIWHDAPNTAGTAWKMALALARFTQATGAYWHRSGGSTGARLMRESMATHRYALEPGAVPPPARQPGTHLDGALVWLRDLEGPELHARYLVSLDRNAAWLAAAGMATLGVGAGVHVSGAEAATVHRIAKAGMFRLTDYAPPLAPLARGLPDPLESHALRGKGARWVSLPTLQLLDELGASYTIGEAHVWAQGHRALEPWYKRLRDGRAALIDAGTLPALNMLKECYTKGLGWLAGSESDQWDRSEDALYRPDWYASIKSLARANMYRAAVKAASAGYVPLAASTDAWYYLTSSPDALDGLQDARGKAIYAVGRDMAAWKRAAYDLTAYPDVRAVLLATKRPATARLQQMLVALNQIDAARGKVA